jgi:ligand-binding sensor domain-containing protein/signal transduction histidine kinase
MKSLHRLFSFLLLCIYSFCNAQKPSVKFEHLNINQGLSQNNIMCILQDKRGFMWFGTRDGLNKYDGYKFTIYRNDPDNKYSISNNFITAIAEDSKGIIWIATRGGGLNRYDREKDKFDHISISSESNNISNNLLDGLAKDHSDNLWICTEDNGIIFFDTKQNRVLAYRHTENNENSLCSNNVRCVFEDSDQNIWIGSYDAGIDCFNPKTKTFTHFNHSDKNKTSLSGGDVKTIFEDRRKNIWIGTTNGLNLLDRQTKSFQHFFAGSDAKSISGNVIGAINEDKNGNIWIGTENNGVDIYDPIKKVFYHYLYDPLDEKSISHNSIYSIYKDRQANMWVGTFAGGVNLAATKLFTHYNHTSDQNSLSNNNVLCLSESKNGNLWVGTDGGGLNVFDPKTKSFTAFKHIQGNKNSICGNYVLSTCEDSKGNVWIGTWADGITVYNPKTNSYKHFKNDPNDRSSLSSNNAWVIFEDHEKNIWVGTYGGGLNRFNNKTNTFKRYDDTVKSVITRQIYAIAEDEKGNLWIGTDGDGLRILNKTTGQFESLKHKDSKNSLSDNRINYILRDEDNNFWISTMTGLCYFDAKTNQLKTYTTTDGLPNNVIFATVKDAKGNLWVSTNRGLSCFDVQTKKFTNFSISDGLQSYEYKAHAVCKSSWGDLYFGGINGFNEFNPDKIKPSAFEPPLVFTDFQIFNKKIQIENDSVSSPLKKDIAEINEITLPDKNSVISFEFASLNFTGKDYRKYSYMLKGFDQEWNNIGSRHTATYTNLDPGTYIFKVRGSNNTGEWSSNISEIKLIITPSFWKTWWFKLLIALSVVFMALGYYTLRINSIKKQKIKLQQLVEQQTTQLVQKNKELEQFAYIASHDLQEPLRTASSFVDLLQKEYKGKLDAKADKYLTFISQSTDRMRILIRDLLEYSRIGRKKELSTIDCNELLQQILADLSIAIKENNAEVKFENLPVINGYSTEMKQLFQNLISNALKFHAPEKDPEIIISGNKKNDSWEFVCKDNGIGIAPEHSEKIFVIFQRLHSRTQYEGSGIGLANCKKIVELHGGDIWVQSKPGEGSTFHFTIPEIQMSQNLDQQMMSLN